jgi:ABC-2 type transport system permease protein
MRNVLTITDKEIKAYFASPIAYSAFFIFLLITGFTYDFYVMKTHLSEMTKLFWWMIYLLMLIVPGFTMHLFSEERRSGTIELLMTYPIQDWEVVLGKFCAGMALFIGMLVLTFHYPLFLFMWGNPEPGAIITGYIGLIFLGAAFISIGILATSSTGSSNTAYVITAGVLFGFLIIGSLGMIGSGPVFRFLAYISLIEHFRTFSLGVLNSKDIVFYLTVIIFAIFFSIRVVEIERWKS